MIVTNHIAPELLRQFSDGRLSTDGSDVILRHLAVCEFCLELANAFWLAEPENSAAAFPQRASTYLQTTVIEKIKQMRKEGY